MHAIGFEAAGNVHADGPTGQACRKVPAACAEQRVHIFSGDQSDRSFLRSVVGSPEAHDGYDVIVDDGSHVPAHVITSFAALWPLVRPGGVYVVEDTETSYWDSPGARVYGHALPGAGIGRPPPANVVEFFKLFADIVSRHHFYAPDLSVLGGVDKDIKSVEFGDGIVFVHKMAAHDAGYPRDLRFPGAVRTGPGSALDAWIATRKHLESFVN